MNSLILGNGYLGRHIHKSLSDSTLLSKAKLNYSDPYLLKDYLDTHNHNYIINCSGFTGIPNMDACESKKEECYHYNVTVPLLITRVANELNIPIIHLGSGCIYNGPNVFTEQMLPNLGSDCYESSFYSKTKDAFEKLSSHLDRSIFRIRICFNGDLDSKNYLYKLLSYDNLINQQNSITNIEDLCVFTKKFINLSLSDKSKDYSGIYNVTNKGSISASEIVQMFKEQEVFNSNWKFVSIDQANFKATRSNCILSTEKIRNLDLELPCVKERMRQSVLTYSNNLKRFK